MLNTCTAFKITAITNGAPAYEKQLRKLLQHTRLTSIQWINMVI